jgi:hypothetical protein
MNRNDWIRGWYNTYGIPLGPNDPETGVPCNVVGGVCWIESEGSNALCNPLDTEQPWPNSTFYNSVGVRNYQTVLDGWAASITTLRNGYYSNLLYVLMNPINADELVAAIHASPWGSKPTETMLDNVRNNWAAYANVFVSGTGSMPSPPPPTPPTPPKELEVLIAGTPTDKGYWQCLPTNGAIYSFGDAIYFGGVNNVNGHNVLVPGDVITGFASTKSAQGYWITTEMGFIYAFGAATYMGAQHTT